MPVWRRVAGALLFAAIAVMIQSACSSSGGAGAGTQSCKTSGDCTKWSCNCSDGSSSSIAECLGQQCLQGTDACGGMCDGHGGLRSATPLPSVSDSPECDAFCAKVLGLGCTGDPRCDRSFWCGLSTGDCPDQKRAELQCQVDTGTWECMPSGGWSMSSGCASARCPADAGTD